MSGWSLNQECNILRLVSDTERICANKVLYETLNISQWGTINTTKELSAMKRFLGVLGFVVFCFGFFGCKIMPPATPPTEPAIATAEARESQSGTFRATGTGGGTLMLINDTGAPEYFSIYFDGESAMGNKGANIIHPSQTITATSDKSTSYVVYGLYSYSNVLWTGILSGDQTIELRFSTLH